MKVCKANLTNIRKKKKEISKVLASVAKKCKTKSGAWRKKITLTTEELWTFVECAITQGIEFGMLEHELEQQKTKRKRKTK